MRILVLTLAALVLAGAASAATSPRDIYRAAMVAAALERSVHYVSASNVGGNHETIVGDAGLGRGIQRITFRKAGSTGHVTVIVIGPKAYVRGDAFALPNFLGMTSAQTATFANKWFVITGPSQTYAVIAEAVEFRSFVRELLIAGPLTTAPSTSFGGKHATGVRSTLKKGSDIATIDLFVGDKTPLPLGEVEKGSRGSITTTLSRWNEAVTLAAPKGALAFR